LVLGWKAINGTSYFYFLPQSGEGRKDEMILTVRGEIFSGGVFELLIM
jgi:hypothetical protein